MTGNVAAAENYTYEISATTTTPTIGSEFEVAISLTNYAEMESGIRGLQIDVTNIDPDVLEVVSHSAMLTEITAASNKTSYSSTGNYVRYVYLKISGTMDKTATDLMKFRLKVKDTLTEDGTITLPITIKIGTTSENITLKDSLTINYTTASANVSSVDVSWGSMEFIYDEGEWDTESHKWVNGGWEPSAEDSNLIAVANTGNTDVKMQLSYATNDTNDDLSGSFTDEAGNEITSAIGLAADGEVQKYWFSLYGTTAKRWDDEFLTLGKITLTLTE
jgi:hypothetical protein